MFNRLQRWLTAPTRSQRWRYLWFGLSCCAPLIYGAMALQQGWGNALVQDDARQYIFWMQRFSDPSLFPGDPIADYFQSVSPIGYVGLYRLGAAAGLEPFLFNKLLPLPLALITTAYLFWLTLEILPVPFTGFVATLLLNQTLWMKDDVISATPRAFVYPLFAAFLYAWVRYRTHPEQPLAIATLGCALPLLLLGLFYPQYVLVASGVLALHLVGWRRMRGAKQGAQGKGQQWPIQLQMTRRDGVVCGVGLGLAVVVMAYYALTASDYGPTITAAQARQLPEFWPGGRNFFFSNNLWWFYFLGDRSGLLHVGLVRPATLCLGLLLPLLLWRRVPLAQAMAQLGTLWRIWLAGFIWFVAAHLLLFRLHLPSRYMDHTWRFVMAIAAALVITAMLDALLRWGKRAGQPAAAGLGIALIAALLLAYPAFVENFPLTKYKSGLSPRIERFFRAQPVGSRVASIAEAASNLPAFAARPVVVGREYAIPYHLGYYRPFRERAIALTKAQYSPDLAELQATIRRYDIDFWLLEGNTFDADYVSDSWVAQYQADFQAALAPFYSGAEPALANAAPACRAVKAQSLQVIDADCLLGLYDRLLRK
ncbi:MAG: hypothetical protein ACFB5Z_09360 [Elainellaceae cyanobacterium]